MMTRTLFVAVTLAGLLAPETRAHAEEIAITGPLAGAPAVRHMRVYRKGRLQIQPFIGFTIQDQFTRTLLTGAQLQYHITDWLGLGLWGAYGVVGIDTGLTDEIEANGQTTSRNVLSLPERRAFERQIGQITWTGAAQVAFIPLRGKLALFQKVFVDADFYLFGGFAMVGIEERADTVSEGICEEAPATETCLDTQRARASRMAPTGTFGVGFSFFVVDFFALSFEWRALPFSWNTSGTDEGGSDRGAFPDGEIDKDDRIFRFNQMISLGFQIYLPTTARLSE